MAGRRGIVYTEAQVVQSSNSRQMHFLRDDKALCGDEIVKGSIPPGSYDLCPKCNAEYIRRNLKVGQ